MAKIYIMIYFLISILYNIQYNSDIDMNTIKKSLIKTAKNAHNRCLFLMKNEFAKSMKPPPIRLCNIF